jgi:ligand-binding sensor domain-containing protein
MVTFSRKKIFCASSFWLVLQLATAQQYNFVNYTINDGLPNSNILSVLQDSRGFLWLGTTTGIASFNGENWQTHHKSLKIKPVPVYDIFEDHYNSIWFAMGKNGVFRYNGKNTLQLHDSINVISICEDVDGNILLASKDNGIYKLKNNSNQASGNQIIKTEILNDFPNITVFHMLRDKDGNIWLGTNKGLLKYDGLSIEEFNLFNGLPHNKVTKVFEDNLGRIWFCTPRGIGKYDYEKFQIFTQENGLNSNQINTISQDATGKIWLGGEKGIDLFDDEKFQHLSIQNGLVDEHINVLKLDNSGNMWIGSEFGGVSMFPGYAFTRYSKEEGLISNQVFSIEIDGQNNLYIGTLDGLNIVPKGKFEPQNFKVLEIDRRINEIHADSKGKVWIGAENGMYLFENNFLTASKQFDSLNVTSISSDIKARLWLVAENELYSSKETQNDEIIFEKSKLLNHLNLEPENKIKCLFSDNNGNIWFGFNNGPPLVFDGKKITKASNPYSELNINCFAEDYEGKIWIGTEYNGVIILGKEKGTWKVINELNPETGFWFSKVNSILFLNENTCLLGSNRGIIKINLDSEKNIISQKKMGLAEGVNSLEPTNNTLKKTINGKVLIGSLHGLIIYDPLQEELNLSPPQTHITSVKLFFEEIDWSNSDYSDGQTSWFNIPAKLKLPPDHNHITFEFTGINLKAQTQVRYQWKLNPLEANWSPPGQKNEITYSELPPGDYTFYVKSYNEDGTANIKPAVFEFRINKPFYKTTWFILITVLFFIGLGLLALQWRTKQLQHAKEKLEIEVAKRTSQLKKEKDLVEEQNHKILQQSEELEAQTDKLFQYTALLEIQNRDITDSINYARTIQKAVLGSRNLIRKIIPKSFVLYIPKDIVSGDFYWFSQQEEYIYIAAVDCTGHGVPGALMSIIGYHLLKETLSENKYKTAGEILDKLNISLIDLLSTHKTKGFSKNGMDVALCRINIKEREINFAGAMRPLYWLKNHINSNIEVIKPNRFGIGEKQKEQQFKNHYITLSRGDRCYLFTDGYTDQFGGEDDKKYLAKRFKKLLLSLKDVPMQENESKLYDAFMDWKGLKKEQTDDILIIGLEF